MIGPYYGGADVGASLYTRYPLAQPTMESSASRGWTEEGDIRSPSMERLVGRKGRSMERAVGKERSMERFMSRIGQDTGVAPPPADTGYGLPEYIKPGEQIVEGFRAREETVAERMAREAAEDKAREAAEDKARKKKLFNGALIVLGVATAGFWLYDWYRRRPINRRYRY